MAVQIAQLTVPADGGGNPLLVLMDWPRGKIYFVNTTTIRSYSVDLVTQSPILSASVMNSTVIAGDVDPVSGALILQRPPAGQTLLNCNPVFKLDPSSFAALGSYGAYTSTISYPTSLVTCQDSQSLVCVGVGTLASGGGSLIGYALLKAGVFGATVAAIRVSDTMAHAGFDGAIVSGSVNNRAIMCRGASGATGGSVFLTWEGSTNGATPTIPLYRISIAPGAETYNPATWPTTNPYITSATVGTIAAASVDATWSNLAAFSIGYDNDDGNVLMEVRTTDVVALTRYMIKVNAATAGVIWASPISTTAAEQLQASSISHNYAALATTSQSQLIATDTGVVTSATLAGLTFTGVTATGFTRSSDTAALLAFHGNFTQGVNSPVPVSGTPSSFSNGYALIGGIIPEPVIPAVFTAADLWFGATDGFVDLSVQANRRKFLGVDGSTQYLGTDGSVPFGLPPAVFLTLADALPADDWALNHGTGGAFAITGPDLGLAGSRPPCGTYQSATDADPNSPQGADPQIRLRVSDDGGRTWSLLEKWRSMGDQGEYRKRLRWLKMGVFRQRIIEIQVTDPVMRNLVGFYQDVKEGMG